MACGPWLLTNAGRTSLLNGDFDLDSDTFNVALFLSTSNLGAASTTYAALTNEVGQTNTGYTTGGIQVSPLTLTGTTTVVVDWTTNPSWTAGSANLTAKWACLYEVSGKILAYCLLDSGGSDVTITNGNVLTIDPPAGGILSLA